MVVGAGYTGLSAALRLAEAGCRVAVLEGAAVGFGGSGRNVGLVNAGLWLPPDDVAERLGEEHGERLLDLLGDAPRFVFDLVERHGILCEAERAGTLHCAAGPKGLRDIERRTAQWAARGAPVRLLGAAETTARTGTGAYIGSLFDARAGTVQPLAYARGLARAAIAAGARVFAESPVVGCERVASGGGAWRVFTPSGSVSADWVVVATNAYTAAPWPELRGSWSCCPTSTSPRRRSATTPALPCCPAARAPGTRGACSAPSGRTAPAA